MARQYSATASISLLALALAGCNKSAPDLSAITASPSASASPDSGLPPLPAALPMQTGPASQITTAPPVYALPTRRYVNVARPANDRQSYAYLDRASDIEDEIGDAPPDYDYRSNDGVSPYVWQTGGGDYRYAEPVDGGYRYYYYQPGAQYPYLVRTNNYSYAYAGAALVAVYALSGALLSHDHYDSYRDDASRYFWRGQQLRQYNDQSRHEGVNAANWAAQRAEFSAAQANWAAQRAQQSAWAAYHAQNDPSQRPGWQQEHQWRQAAAQQFTGWQSRGFNGPPPPALAAGGERGGGQHGYYGGQGQYPAPAQNGGGPQMNGAPGGYPNRAQNQQPYGPAPAFEQQRQAQQAQLAQLAQRRADTNKFMTQQAKDAQRAADLRQQAANDARHQQEVAAQQRAIAAQQQARDAQRAADLRQQAANNARHQQEVAAQQRAIAAQQAGTVRHEADLRQQAANNARHQQEMAAQQMREREAQQRAAQQREEQQRLAQQREAQASARQAQAQAEAARHQAQIARAQETRAHPGQPHPEAGHEHEHQ